AAAQSAAWQAERALARGLFEGGLADGFVVLGAQSGFFLADPRIVRLAPLGVGQDLVGAVDQAHDAFGTLVPRVAIGMVLLAERAIRRADHRLGCIARYLEILVVGMHAHRRG